MADETWTPPEAADWSPPEAAAANAPASVDNLPWMAEAVKKYAPGIQYSGEYSRTSALPKETQQMLGEQTSLMGGMAAGARYGNTPLTKAIGATLGGLSTWGAARAVSGTPPTARQLAEQAAYTVNPEIGAGASVLGNMAKGAASTGIPAAVGAYTANPDISLLDMAKQTALPVGLGALTGGAGTPVVQDALSQAARKVAPRLTASGAVIPPHITNPEGAAKLTEFGYATKEGDSGVANVEKAAAVKNSEWKNEQANKILGQKAGSDIDQNAIDSAIDKFSEPYRAAVAGNPQAEAELEAMRTSQKIGQAKFMQYHYGSPMNTNFNNPQTLAEAEAAYKQADVHRANLVDQVKETNRGLIAQQDPQAGQIYAQRQQTQQAAQQLRQQADHLISQAQNPQGLLGANGQPVNPQPMIQQAQQLQQRAAQLDAVANYQAQGLDAMVQKAGLRDPSKELDKARIKLAQVGALARRTNPMTGEVDVVGLARDRKTPGNFLDENGKPGSLELLADAGQTFPSLFTKNPKAPSNPASAADKYAVKGAAVGSIGGFPGAKLGGAIGYGLGKGVDMAKEAARARVLSPEYIAANQPRMQTNPGVTDLIRQMMASGQMNPAFLSGNAAITQPNAQFLQSVAPSQ